jgi:hypothetical protein
MKGRVTVLVLFLSVIGMAHGQSDIRILLQNAVLQSNETHTAFIQRRMRCAKNAIPFVPTNAYTEARDQIVSLAKDQRRGSNVVAELEAVSADARDAWQMRLMASICLERVKRGDEIQALIHCNWGADPEYDQTWGRGLAGPCLEMSALMLKRYSEKKLWYYYAEILWKETEEHPSIHMMHPESWRTRSISALKKSPAREYLLRILEVRVQRDPILEARETLGDFKILAKECEHDTFPILLTVWKQRRSVGKRGFLDLILAKAETNDIALLEEAAADKKTDIESRHTIDDIVTKLRAQMKNDEKGIHK